MKPRYKNNYIILFTNKQPNLTVGSNGGEDHELSEAVEVHVFLRLLSLHGVAVPCYSSVDRVVGREVDQLAECLAQIPHLLYFDLLIFTIC